MECSFENVCVSVNGNQILHGVSGSVCPGELMAIMGPSGASKTTLLNTLNGRMPYTGIITVGNSTLSKSQKRKMCYVLQQDFFFGNLTLADTLQFTAMIRLPDTMGKKQKLARMNAVIQALDLTKCLNTIMGDMFTPGLSGGEKKRASIACELLRDPAVILLDEPTTGLDSSTAASLISLLQTYAQEERKTIIASIHQPSSHIFFQFDKLLLLTDGSVAYCGRTDAVVDYFSQCGVHIEENYNPADFILEALSENEEVKGKLLKSASSQNFRNRYGNSTSGEDDDVTKVTYSKADSYIDDLDVGSVRMSLLDLDVESDSVYYTDEKPTNNKWPTGVWTQYSQLMLRTMRQSRSRVLSKMKILENLVICGFMSLIFFQLPRTEETLRDRMGAVFFISAHWGFIPLFDAVTSFPLERMVINKERSAGWYRLSAYYLAKMTSELVLILIQPTLFVVIAYWVIGLNGISAFLATLGTVYIDSIAGQSFGLFVGIVCLQISQAMTVSITLQMAIMLLGGLFTRNLPSVLFWMKYLSFLHYSFNSLMFLEFHEAEPIQCLTEENSSAFTICQQENVTSIPSAQVLEYYDITWSYWEYLLPLFAYIIVFRTLGYLTLRYFRKPF